MRDDLPLLVERIRALLDVGEDARGDGLLPRIEHTLTDGYAHALALEAERARIEKRIAEVALELGDSEQAAELRELAARLNGTEEEHGSLRSLLAELSRLADDLRAAEALR